MATTEDEFAAHFYIDPINSIYDTYSTQNMLQARVFLLYCPCDGPIPCPRRPTECPQDSLFRNYNSEQATGHNS
jgi:hypothetical protein